MVKWTPKSQEDLGLIQSHIAANFNIGLAIETTNSLIDFVEQTLSTNPLAGRLLESNPLFSKILYKGNSINYCEHPRSKDIYIVHVRPGKNKYDKNRGEIA